ncbi:MAG TPA: hypothetical protein VFU86_23250 [Terriglobales bacterium]|nr:hypothetical protein [Terriglobales bacterium]
MKFQSPVVDVADAATIERAAKIVATRSDHLDVLANNAGINCDTWRRLRT